MRQISWKERFIQDQKEFFHDSLGCLFSPGCLLLTLGIVGLILFMVCICVFDIRFPNDTKVQERASSAKNIAWDYLKEQEPTAKITSISSSPLNSSVTVVQGKLKKKNAFGQWAHHSFRITVTDGLVTGCETKFLGFK